MGARGDNLDLEGVARVEENINTLKIATKTHTTEAVNKSSGDEDPKERRKREEWTEGVW